MQIVHAVVERIVAELAGEMADIVQQRRRDQRVRRGLLLGLICRLQHVLRLVHRLAEVGVAAAAFNDVGQKRYDRVSSHAAVSSAAASMDSTASRSA